MIWVMLGFTAFNILVIVLYDRHTTKKMDAHAKLVEKICRLHSQNIKGAIFIPHWGEA